MNDFKTAFDAFAAGYAASFAAGYADSRARAREDREHEEAEYLAYAISSGEEDIRDHIDVGYGPGEWYEDEGEWVQVPMDPGQESARLRAEEAASRRRYDADVTDGKARFAAALTPQFKPRDTDFSLDLLSAFATAYAIGAGGGACVFHLLPALFSQEDLYEAAGVAPDVKAAILAVHEAARAAVFSLGLSDEAKTEAKRRASDAVKSATEAQIGFIGRSFPAGNEARRIYDAGVVDGYDAGEERAYEVASKADYDAVLAACDGNVDIAERVVNAIGGARPNNAFGKDMSRLSLGLEPR